MQQDNTARNIWLAAQWYEHGGPTWETDGASWSLVPCIDYERLGDLWRGIEAERLAHHDQAHAVADKQLPPAPVPDSIDIAALLDQPLIVGLLGDAGAARRILYECEYTRLEAAAKLRRILALSACLTEAEPAITAHSE